MISYNEIQGEPIKNLVNSVLGSGEKPLANNTLEIKNGDDTIVTNKFSTACNMVRVSADISGEFTTARVSVKIYRHDGNEEVIDLNDCVAGSFCDTFDAANFAVYHDAKEFRIQIRTLCEEGFLTIENLKVCPLEGIQQSEYYAETFPELMRNLCSGVDSLQTLSVAKIPTLVSPLGKKFTLAVNDDGTLFSIPNVPEKTVILGNSLLLGMQFYGMCASSPEKDYAYYLHQAILKKNPKAVIEKIFGAPFETAETDELYDTWWENVQPRGIDKTVKDVFTPDVDLIIVQLGDNVNNTARVNIFEKHAERFISSVKRLSPKARIIWVMGYYNRVNTYSVLSKLSSKWSFSIVDISDLNVKENQSYSGAEYTLEDGSKAIVKDGWITHPGDEGMKKIADRIIAAIDM